MKTHGVSTESMASRTFSGQAPRQVRLRTAMAGLLAALIVPATAACGAQAPSSPPPNHSGATAGQAASTPATTKLTVVKVGTLSGGSSDYPVFLADSLGYFAKEGIKNDYVPFQNAGDLIAPLASGQLDVGGGSDSAAFFNGLANGVNVKIVADKGVAIPGLPYQYLVIRKDLITSGRVKSYADLKGLKFAISGNGVTTQYMLSDALHLGGLSLKDVHTSTMTFPDMYAALANKSVDGAVLGGLFAVKAKANNIAVLWKGTGSFAPYHHISLVLFGPRFIQNQPAVGKRWITAYMEGVRAYDNAFFRHINEDKMATLLQNFLHVKNANLIKSSPITISPNLTIHTGTIAQDQNWYAAHGYVKHTVDVSRFIDSTFVDAALRKLGRKPSLSAPASATKAAQ